MDLLEALRIVATRPPPLLAAMHQAERYGSPVLLEETKRLIARHAKAKAIVEAAKKKKRADGDDPEPIDDNPDAPNSHPDDGDDEDDETADKDRAPRRRGTKHPKRPTEPSPEQEIAAANRLLARARAFVAAQKLARRRARLRREERQVAKADCVLRAARFDDRTRGAAHLKLYGDRKPPRVDYAEQLRALTKAGLSKQQQAEALTLAHARGAVDTSMVCTGQRWDSWGREVR